MGDWEELAQSVLIGLIFSFLVAKLISMVMTFRDKNLRVVREGDLASVEPIVDRVSEREPIVEKSRIGEEDEVIASEKQEKLSESFLGEDEDDWDGVESTELDEEFTAATAFVAAAAADRLSQKVSNDVQLQLYGLYKIATEGPCNTPLPSAFQMTARAKWRLDAIHDAAREGERDTMLKYIESGVSVNLKDGEGRTPLHWAVDRGHLEVVELLISNNAEVNAKE